MIAEIRTVTSTATEPRQSSVSYEVVRRFIQTAAFESPFGLQLLANILNDIILGHKSDPPAIKTPADEKRADGRSSCSSTGWESISTDLSDSTVLYSMDTSYGEKEIANIKLGGEDSLKKAREGENPQGEEKDEDGEEKELEKLLRMTYIKPKARADSNSGEEKEKKERERKNLKSQLDEPSLLECMEGQTGNGGENIDAEPRGNDQDDFSVIANREAKKAFLLTSDESCRSSEPEENLEQEEKTKEKNTKDTQGPKQTKKDDLREFRIPNLNADDDDGGGGGGKVEKLLKRESLKGETETSRDSDDSVMYVQQVKVKPESSNNSEQTHDSDSGSDVEQVYCRTASSPQKGRKNIKKILKKENLQVETKQALKLETERKKRVAERQKLFDRLFPGDDTSKLILDFDPQTKEELLVVEEKLTQQLKPHQREGVRFMWNCCFESLTRLEEDSGSGCILAHCMGLGKTLQVITLVHTILTRNTGVHTVMIMCPLNTIQNWTREFKTWQRNCEKKVLVNLLQFKSVSIRKLRVQSWLREGGVLIISYEMFRTLIKNDYQFVFSKCFLDPGPDMVVCDEGHVLKNNNSALSKCMSRMKTLRRIILTGTPLQNNLMEYYCMVNFVKPNILGTQKEFKNRFVHPINNGQFEDSTELDVRLMKRRAHVLHTMLDGFIQRFGYYVLTPFLPEKQEYVISIALTETQERIYKLFIDRCIQENRGLLKDFHCAQNLWTHPLALLWRAKSNNKEDEWWTKFIPKKDFEDIGGSGKLVLLFDILRRSKETGDKVLLFSQSLCSLNLIEFFLRKANENYSSGIRTGFSDSWVLGQDYCRLDGSTSSVTRDTYCRNFNRADNDRFRLFLVSTRAGGLGINLVAANRVVVFDASWNPTHDVQSIFRVYRFGQKKPCFIYRFLAASTMEEKIYRRQVTKLSLAHRILDEHQIERHYTMVNLQELYTYDPVPKSEWKSPKIPKDKLFAEVLANRRDIIVGYHEHDSLLENKEEEELTEEERRAAWEDYETEKLTVEYPTNGFPAEVMNRINREGLSAIQNYKKGIPAFQNVPQDETQVCKIVDVRTLHGGETETKKLLEFGRSLGLKPFNEESVERYCMRVDQELKKIFPWGTPGSMTKGVVSNAD